MEHKSQSVEDKIDFECLTKLLLTIEAKASQEYATTTTDEEDTKPFMYTHTKWSAEKLELLVQDTRSGKCYRGHLALTELNDIADELEIVPVLFAKECREALSATIALPPFEYYLELTPEGNNFKLLKNCDVPIIYLEIALTELKGNVQLMDAAIALLHVKQERNVTKKNSADDGVNARQGAEALNVLAKLQEERDLFQRRLLKKVTLLLQTKKDRIAELENQLAEALQRVGNGTRAQRLHDEDEDVETDCSDDFNAATQAL